MLQRCRHRRSHKNHVTTAQTAPEVTCSQITSWENETYEDEVKELLSVCVHIYKMCNLIKWTQSSHSSVCNMESMFSWATGGDRWLLPHKRLSQPAPRRQSRQVRSYTSAAFVEGSQSNRFYELQTDKLRNVPEGFENLGWADDGLKQRWWWW